MEFVFRARTAARDRETDETRFSRLVDFIRKTRAEIASEAEGLGRRCDKARCNASFAMEADEQNKVLDQKIRTLSDTIISCENRLAALERQTDFLNVQEQQLLSFVRHGANPL